MCSGENTRALPRVGFPIRKSRDQRLVSTSPGLIAAAHVLHRLLAPRHPPCALRLLIMKNTFVLPLWSFQGARALMCAKRENPPRRPVSQNSAARVPSRSHRRGLHDLPVDIASDVEVEVDVSSRRARAPDDRVDHRTGRTPTGSN